MSDSNFTADTRQSADGDRTGGAPRSSDDAARPSGLTALVTGGAGFVGSHLARALAEENDVRVLDDLSTGDPSRVPAGAELVRGDVRDRGVLARAMADVDVVFHQAALLTVERSVTAPTESQAVNAAATLDLLEVARNVGARVVVASSAAVYGHPESVPVVESARKEPTSPYGVDKLTIDHYARLYADLYDLETVALRYFNVYGPGHSGGDYSGVIDVFAEQAREGKDVTVHGDGSQTRDFVHVSDVVEANLRAATTDHVGEAFNVGTGRSVTIQELAELVIEATDSTSEIVNTDPRPGDIHRSRADVSKAHDRLGFSATTRVEEGIRSLVGAEPTPPAD